MDLLNLYELIFVPTFQANLGDLSSVVLYIFFTPPPLERLVLVWPNPSLTWPDESYYAKSYLVGSGH